MKVSHSKHEIRHIMYQLRLITTHFWCVLVHLEKVLKYHRIEDISPLCYLLILMNTKGEILPVCIARVPFSEPQAYFDPLLSSKFCWEEVVDLQKSLKALY